MNHKMIIGLVGKAGSGKGEASKYLQGKGYKRLGFTDELKEWAKEYFNLSDTDIEEKSEHVRTILQGLGSFIREQTSESTFIYVMVLKLHYLDNNYFVIDDIRYQEEANLVKEYGGIVVKLECPDSPERLTETQRNHITEQIDGITYDLLISAGFGNIEKIHRELETKLYTPTEE